MEQVTIRECKREDCHALRQSIQELADFQNMPNAPKLTVEDLQRFGYDNENPLFYAYIAELDGKIIGHAICNYAFSSWRGRTMFLNELYISVAFRKKGIGTLLYNAVAKKAKDSNCCRLEFGVLKWNPAVNFYKQKGAIDLTEEEQWHMYSVDGKNL